VTRPTANWIKFPIRQIGNLMQFAWWAVGLSLIGLAVVAPSASATFHEMSIREIYAGSAEHPNAEYVELQMWHSGQNFVGGHDLLVYGPAGMPKENFLASNVAGDANQSTILIATPEAAEQFGVAADEALSPANQLDPAGGAVCWQELDCVSWGSFGGTLPSPAGTPAAAIPDGMALRRTIAPGCATLLEPTDDRDNSAADFSIVSPAPRPNSVAPTERPCGASGGSPEGPNGTGGRGRGAPQTTLKRKPPHKIHDRTPTFRFGSDEQGSTFQCKLDGKPFRACKSPFTTKRLALGQHTFKVRARDESGKLDPSPASYSFRVVAKG
jgi:hypothetical protein